MLTCPHASDSLKMLILLRVFFAGPVIANMNAYANNACRPLFEKNCGNNNSTIQLKNKIIRYKAQKK